MNLSHHLVCNGERIQRATRTEPDTLDDGCPPRSPVPMLASVDLARIRPELLPMMMNNKSFSTLPLIVLSSIASAQAPDGFCDPVEENRMRCFTSAQGFVVEAVPGPNGEFPILDAQGNSVFTYQITGPGASGASCAGVHDVSHASIMIPVCTSTGGSPLTIVDSTPAISLQTNGQGDPSCGFGVGNTTVDVGKWDVPVGCATSRQLSVTFEGSVPARRTSFSLKAANNCETNVILGPSCDPNIVPFCESTIHCPCGPPAANSGGCTNATGVGAVLSATGSTSVAADDLVLLASDLPPNQFGIFLMARSAGPVAQPLGNGVLCLGGPMNKIVRIKPVVSSSAQGTASTMPGLVALSCSGQIAVPAISCITPGSTFEFQLYYRDPIVSANCQGASNLTNALRITFTQ